MAAKLRTLQRLLDLKKIVAKDLCVIAYAARAALQDAKAAPATINATLSALKGVARAAWQAGMITAEDLEKVRDIRSVRGSRLGGRAHSSQEIEAIVKECAKDRSPAGARDATIIALQYNLGLRRAECASLDISDYSPSSQTIRVHGKGDKERTAHLVDRGVRDALANWLDRRTLKPGPLLCPVTREGNVIIRRLTDQAIYDAVVERAKAAGILNLTPHNLRRSFGTDLLDRGVDIAVVSALLGHSSLETTKRYDRRGDPAQRRATALLTLPYQDQRQPQLPFGEMEKG